jgi:hypothetical protein
MDERWRSKERRVFCVLQRTAEDSSSVWPSFRSSNNDDDNNKHSIARITNFFKAAMAGDDNETILSSGLTCQSKVVEVEQSR